MIDLTTIGTVTSGFGNRDTGIPGASTNHKGLDVVLASDNIPAVLGGTVISKGTTGSTGNYIKIQQTDGTTATYMHMAKLPTLNTGDSVTEGQIIGLQGSTGISSGKHLHYQVEGTDGNYIDPQRYFTSTTGNFSNGAGFTVTDTGTENDGLSLMGKVVKFLAILLLCIAAAYLFIKSFNIGGFTK